MLIDLDFKLPADPTNGHPDFKIIKARANTGGVLLRVQYKDEPPATIYHAERLQKGVYDCWMLEHVINEFTEYRAVHNFSSLEDTLKNIRGEGCPDADLDSFGQYGSADTVEQILAYKNGRFLTSAKLFVLELHWLTKEIDGGYRWHKNGPHIGLKEPQYECFGNEPEIDKIITFKYHELALKNTK